MGICLRRRREKEGEKEARQVPGERCPLGWWLMWMDHGYCTVLSYSMGPEKSYRVADGCGEAISSIQHYHHLGLGVDMGDFRFQIWSCLLLGSS